MPSTRRSWACASTPGMRSSVALTRLELLDDYFDIVRHIHIKDCDLAVLDEVSRSGGGMMEAWDRGVFCELGLGTAGLDDFLDRCSGAGLGRLDGRRAGPVPQARGHARGVAGLQLANRDWLAERGF